MKRVMRKIWSFALTVIATVSLGALSLSASALDNGIYVATSTSYYAHPYTGVIEDSGGADSQVLGQSMTESALCPEALIEVDPNGNMYATIRLSLMDNIENPQFMVQENADSPFYDVSADCMQENFDVNTSDFRFMIPNESCIVRSTFYVVPMGRDVIFYIGFSDLREGSSDFVTSVEVVEVTEAPIVTEPPTEEAVTETIAETTTEAAVTTTTTAITTSVSTETTTEKATAENTEENVEAVGIVMFDENGNQISEIPAADGEKTESDEVNGMVIAAAVIITAGIIAVIIFVPKIIKKRGKIK